MSEIAEMIPDVNVSILSIEFVNGKSLVLDNIVESHSHNNAVVYVLGDKSVMVIPMANVLYITAK